MFDFLKSRISLVEILYKGYEYKVQHGYGENILTKQLETLQLIDKKEHKVQKHIFKEIKDNLVKGNKEEILANLSMINKSQEDILRESIQKEISEVVDALRNLKKIIEFQLNDYRHNHMKNMKSLLGEESKQLELIRSKIHDDKKLEAKFAKNMKEVMKLEHSDGFRKIVKGVSKVVMGAKFNVIVTGQEHIPKRGPVVIAPRHFHGDYDPMLFFKVMHRKVFFLGATDWMKEGVQLTVNKWVFKKTGVIPINRPDSAFQKSNVMGNLRTAFKDIVRVLMLNQALVVFPEGWPNVDSHYTPKKGDEQEIEIKAGIMHFVDYVQKRRKMTVPIVPVGVHYDDKGVRKNIVVNIGKPIHLKVSDRKDYNKYMNKVQDDISHLSKAA